MSTNNSVDVYVRVTCPKSKTQSNVYGKQDGSHVGHYDLVIDTPITFNGRFGVEALNNDKSNRVEFAQPTFSWGTNHHLDISTLTNAKNRQHENYEFYKWKFTTTMDKVEALIDAFESVVDEDNPPTLNSAKTMISFRPSSESGFHNYVLYNKNCFAATAVWMRTIGISDLEDILYSAPSRRVYTRVLDIQVGAFNDWETITL